MRSGQSGIFDEPRRRPATRHILQRLDARLVCVLVHERDPRDADHLLKGKLRRQKQHAALSRAHIDEDVIFVMNLQPGEKLRGRPVDVVFIGSCTNARISDLRLAASVFKGRHVSPGVKALVVPGSQAVKRQAEAEGLDRIFKEAGVEWREAGCSMCLGMNGDRLQPGQYAISTSNRNFEGRQGPGGRTFLASPLTAAASAITGRITDAREFTE